MTAAELRDRAPQGDPLTDYDRAQATVYLRLLDADAQLGELEVQRAGLAEAFTELTRAAEAPTEDNREAA